MAKPATLQRERSPKKNGRIDGRKREIGMSLGDSIQDVLEGVWITHCVDSEMVDSP